MVMPAPGAYREKAVYVWRGLALLLALLFAQRSGPAALPVPLAAAAAALWLLAGWNARAPLAVAACCSAAVLAVGVFFWHEPWSFACFVPIWAALSLLPLAAPLRLASWAPRAAEALRILAALGAGAFALAPFLHDGIMGGDDAKWYTAVVADHVEQWRMGLWPVFVGQTHFAAIGTVLPLRVAPYLQHLTVALDLATGRTLSPYLLLNLAVFLSGCAGGLSAYLCLGSMLPGRRPEALLLALLYVWCPGVIGLPYTGQLFMSEMTLPFLPMVFAGVYRIFRRDDFSGWALAAAGCAGCWLAHSPIGLWASIAGFVALAARWASGLGWTRAELVRAALAAALFAALCGYVFVSVSVLAATEPAHTQRDVLLMNVRNTFPAVLLPVSHNASEVSDLQPGWALFALALAGCVAAWARGGAASRCLSLAALLLLCLALPVPGINAWLWQALPQAVVDATNAAPTQRLYAILAACTVTLSAALLAALPGARRPVLAALALAAAWSAWELRPFLLRGSLISNSKARSEEALLPENLLMTPFSLGMLSYQNRFFSYGVMDFALEQRVLGPDLHTYIVSNVRSIAPQQDFGRRAESPRLPHAFEGTSPPGERIWVMLTPGLTLRPGRRYLLPVEFPAGQPPVGILQLKGDGFIREYSLPASGMPFAFGASTLSSRVIPLSSSSSKPLDVTVAFINQDPGADLARYHDFARYDLIEYDPKDLPIRLESLAPYKAQVRSPAAGWLETFRYYTPGWTATVNGAQAPVRRSWNGLVAVPVGAGESEVRVTFRPPAALLASYWTTWVAWAALAFYGILRLGRHCFSSAGPKTPAKVITA